MSDSFANKQQNDRPQSSSDEDEEPIRYFEFVFNSIIFFIFIYLNQSKRTNSLSQNVGADSRKKRCADFEQFVQRGRRLQSL